MIETALEPMEPQPEYAHLLFQTQPSIIQSEEQNEAYIAQVADLLRREDSLTPAEAKLVKLLTLLIEDFEEKNYALPKAGPTAAVRFLMDQQGLKQKDLAEVLGTPSIVSEVLSGKRKLNYGQIRRLSDRFQVSPELFF